MSWEWKVEAKIDPASPSTWVEITAAKQVSFTRGRNHELGRTEVGTLTVEIDNFDRAFDPSWPGGAYYGALVLDREVRVTVTVAGVDYVQFYGYATEWRPVWDNDQAITVLRAADGLQALAALGQGVPPVALEAWLVGDVWKAAGYWPLDGLSGDDVAGANDSDRVGGSYLSLGDPLVHGRDAAVVWSSSIPTNVQSGFVAEDVDAALSGDDTTVFVSLWVAHQAGVSGPLVTVSGRHPVNGRDTPAWAVRIVVDDIVFRQINAAGTEETANTGESIDSDPHHLLVVRNRTTGRIYISVDGAVPTSVVYTTGTPWAPSNPAVHLGCAPFSTPFKGRMSDVAVMTSSASVVPDADMAQAIYAAGLDGWAGDTAGVRIARILDIIGWPPGARDLDTGTSVLAGYDGSPPLDHCLDCAEADGGLLFAAGAIRFIGREELWQAHASPVAATFDDDGVEHDHSAIDTSYDDGDFYTRVAVRPPDSKPKLAVNAVVEESSFRRQLDIDTIATDGGEARARAAWLLDLYDEPIVRVRTLTVQPIGDTVAANTAVLELGDLARIVHDPDGGGAAIGRTLRAEHLAVSADRLSGWQADIGLATTRAGWILGDATYGVLGTTTVLTW